MLTEEVQGMLEEVSLALVFDTASEMVIHCSDHTQRWRWPSQVRNKWNFVEPKRNAIHIMPQDFVAPT